MADYGQLSRLTRRADAVAATAGRLVTRAIREIRGELANLSGELNLAGSADDRERAYAMVRQRMARLRRALDRLLAAQSYAAARGAAKSVAEMTGLEVRYSAKRAEAICELVTPSQGESLAAVFTDRMGRGLIDSLREATVAAMRAQAVAGGSMKDLARDMEERWRAAAKDEDPRFVDASGRAWDTATYFQMNVRTNTMRVYNDCLADDVARETGSDVMRISRHGSDPHCACAAWEGCIISLTGRTKGLPTYEDARRGGCFHPNCVHTLDYVDEDADADEIALQMAHPVSKEGAADPDAQDERRYEIDQARKRAENPGMTKEAARVAVDRDNLEAAIRCGLVRGDAVEIVAKMTDAQVTALCPDGNPPRFEPVKRVRGGTRKKPKYEPERWNHGRRGGVVHVSRDADAAHLLEVCRVDGAKQDAKGEWRPTTPLEKATDALMREIGARHTDKPLGIDGANPNYSKGREWQVNCQRCVPAYEARCRGYDVTALSSSEDNDSSKLNLARNSRAMWKNRNIETFTAKNFKVGVERKMAIWGDGARAEVRIGWKGRRGCGHVFMAIQENGKTRFVDPQEPSRDASSFFAFAATRGNNAFHWLLRIDDNEFTEEAKRCFRHL